MSPDSSFADTAAPNSNTGLQRLVAQGHQIFDRLWYSPASWALLDQMIVSGLRFATTMMIGRFCGPEELGIYVLAFSAILFVSLSHESLIAKPYQVFCQSMKATRQRVYTGSALIQLILLAVLVITVALLSVMTMWLNSLSPKLCWVVLTLAATMPGILLWEFVRRQAFAMMDMRSVAILDSCLAFLQLSSLVIMGLLGHLTLVRALILIAICSSVVGMTRLWQLRSRYRVLRRRLGSDLVKNWRFGRWFFAGQIVGLVQSYAVPWILTFYYGAEKTGILMACQTLVLLSNPLLIGLANWLGPASVRTYVTAGVQGMNRLLLKVSLLSNGCMIFFALMLYLLGEWVLVLTFGPDYKGHGHLVAITGVTALGFSMTVSGSSGLSAILYPRVILLGTLTGSLVSVLTLPLMVQQWELTGAAWSLAAGSLTSGSIHLFGYWLFSKANHLQQDAPATEVP
ncbi:MAG: oligosaccharide flippase family protein [Pirellulaceae bacterium]|nr:oligosaccharide flippase family protein [Pirellulaceae bacterium]